jgi:hypothetical protein
MDEYYHIDQKIISILLGQPEDSDAVFEYMDKFDKKIAEQSDPIIFEYFKEQGMSNQEMQDELKRLMDSNLSDESKLLDDELQRRLGEIQQNLVKQIYAYYSTKLPVETKQQLNEYLASIQNEVNQNFETEKRIYEEVIQKLEREYEEQGSIKSADEAEQERLLAELKEYEVEENDISNDESSVQQVAPQTQTRPIQVQLTQTPNVDPVLGI